MQTILNANQIECNCFWMQTILIANYFVCKPFLMQILAHSFYGKVKKGEKAMYICGICEGQSVPFATSEINLCRK